MSQPAFERAIEKRLRKAVKQATIASSRGVGDVRGMVKFATLLLEWKESDPVAYTHAEWYLRGFAAGMHHAEKGL